MTPIARSELDSTSEWSPFVGVAILAVALLAIIVFVGFGSSFLKPLGTEELRSAQERWAEMSPRSYSYRVSRTCFCPSESTVPYTVYVSDGRLTTAIDPTDKEVHGIDELPPEDALSVPRIFRLIDEGLQESGSVTAEYDRVFGYPRLVYLHGSSDVIDDEYSIRVDRFAVETGDAQKR